MHQHENKENQDIVRCDALTVPAQRLNITVLCQINVLSPEKEPVLCNSLLDATVPTR